MLILIVVLDGLEKHFAYHAVIGKNQLAVSTEFLGKFAGIIHTLFLC